MFYTFRQNNSGGSFVYNENVDHYVIIEANSPKEANNLAQDLAGIYFNGCERGWDCDCCGDRWYMQWHDEEGNEVPSIYGTPIINYKSDYSFWKESKSYLSKDLEIEGVIVYYKDGRKEIYKGDNSTRKYFLKEEIKK